jgi:hypothetical protein
MTTVRRYAEDRSKEGERTTGSTTERKIGKTKKTDSVRSTEKESGENSAA